MSGRAIVVGAGINGLATADALMDRGWSVVVADRGPVPNPESASWDVHRLIRPHYADQPVYAERIFEARDAWDDLWRTLGVSHHVETGCLGLSLEAGDWVDRCRADFERLGVEHEVLRGGELAARFPVFETADARYGLHTGFGGVLFCDRILVALAERLRARGAGIVEGFRAETVDWARGAAIDAAGRRLEGDVVIVSAGFGLPALTREVLPVGFFTPMRCVAVYADAPPSLAAEWERAPIWIALGGRDGYDMWGAPPVKGLPLKLGLASVTRPGDPERERTLRDADVETYLSAYRDRLTDGAHVAPRAGLAAFWTMAPGEAFVLRRFDRGVVLSADSGHGFKFGALTGRDAAEAIDGSDFDAVAARVEGRALGEPAAEAPSRT